MRRKTDVGRSPVQVGVDAWLVAAERCPRHGPSLGEHSRSAAWERAYWDRVNRGWDPKRAADAADAQLRTLLPKDGSG